jgi:hypothetical protein
MIWSNETMKTISVILTCLMLITLGCGSDESKEAADKTKEAFSAIKKAALKEADNVVQKTKKAADEAVDQTKKVAEDVKTQAAEVTEKAAKATKETAKKGEDQAEEMSK